MPREYSTIALEALPARYYLRDTKGNLLETEPDHLWRRVSAHIASAEVDEEKKSYWEKRCFQRLSNGDFMFNTPTLMNAGKKNGQLSACFVLPIEDSMEGIFSTLRNAAIVHKTGGGTGFDFSSLRPEGAMVSNKTGVSTGPLAFCQVYDKATEVIKQGSSRRGANMMTFRVDHPDILQFIEMKSTPGVMTNFNVSVSITDEFMEALKNDDEYELKHPFTGTVGKLSARFVWEKIAFNAWKSAEPGIIFIDRINDKSPFHERIESVNPCWTGDTKVWTLYGPRTFKDLAKEGKDVPVLTQSSEGKLIYKMMRRPHRTARAAEIYRVVLDNGKQLRCTPNHNFYLRSGAKIMAKDLAVGMSLASCYRVVANQKGYLKLTNGIETQMEHHINISWKEGRRPDYPFEHCHHINEIKWDNSPDNLEIMSASAHNSMHMKGEKNPLYGVSHPYSQPGKKNGRYRHDITDEQITELYSKYGSTIKVAKTLNCSPYLVQKRLSKLRAEIANHKVVLVEKLHYKQDVYNGCVDDTHSYFVMCGKNDAILSANCGEQPLPPYGACNLGSINLSNFVSNREVMWDDLAECVYDGVRLLDNVIDVNSYPLPEIRSMALKYRNIGIGPMGLADAFIKLGLRYDSDEAVEMSSKLAKFIHNCAHEASYQLAMEKGFPSGYPFATEGVRRNATLDNSAPTGTISLFAGCSSGIEPNFAYELVRNQLDKEFVEYHPLYALHKATGNTYEPEVFVEAQEVSWNYHIKHQAAWQKYVDAGISKTINLPEDADVLDVMLAYRFAYETGCKGVTVYRDGSRGVGVLSKKVVENDSVCCDNPSIAMQDGCETCANCGVSKCSIA